MSEVADKNPPFGRKVFFVGPSSKVRTKIIPVLRELEYEVYVIDRWRDVRNYLSKYPDAICLINADGQLSVQAWMAMVKLFAKDKVLSSIVCGFLTESAVKNAAKLSYAENLPAGYNSMAGDEEQALRTLKHILDVFGAKGRRQYVRCSCYGQNASVYYTKADAGGNPSMFQMRIVDISSATVAVEVPEAFRGKLRLRQWLQNVVITLNGRQVETSLQVFLLKHTDRGTEIAILSYYSGMLKESKAYIRNFIFDVLQREADRSINGMKEDKTDYVLEATSYQLVIDSPEDDKKEKKAKKEADGSQPAEGEAEAGGKAD